MFNQIAVTFTLKRGADKRELFIDCKESEPPAIFKFHQVHDATKDILQGQKTAVTSAAKLIITVRDL